ncbi:MAG: hypothetical protein FK734_08605 [Asgard group archaeon]|nr:hypothetical protein [Asgard group archaeon]
MIIGIDVVFIHVKDPKSMASWYKDKLGIEISFSTPDNSWIEFTLDESRSTTRFALDYPGSNPSIIEQQSIIISFKVKDIESAVNSLKAKGVAFVSNPIIQDVGPTLVATFIDLEGNYLQLSQRK